MTRKAAQERREKFKNAHWPQDIAWTGERPEVGWFRAPRTLPLILQLLSSKKVSGKQDPTKVYLELLSRHRDTGIIEMASEADHSYAAGYIGRRGVRTWQERMKLLVDLGFIKSVRAGNSTHKLVLLIHPAMAVQQLFEAGKIDSTWWTTYQNLQIENKESTHDLLKARHQENSSTKGKKGIVSAVKPEQRVGSVNISELLNRKVPQSYKKSSSQTKAVKKK